MVDVGFYAKAYISLLVLVNPLEGIPIFLSGTEDADAGLRRITARRSSTAVSIILLVSMFLGNAILRLFSISIGAFQIGGGVILFLIALQMVFSATRPTTAPAEAPPGFAIVPLAIPLLAGPGAIAGAILYGTRAHSMVDVGALAGVILLVGASTYASLRGASALAARLKETGISIATSVMGLIIAAIAVEMIANGIASLFGVRVLGG